MTAAEESPDPRVPLNIKIRVSNRARLDAVAALEHRTRSDMARLMLGEALEQYEQKHGIVPAAAEATPSRTRRPRSST